MKRIIELALAKDKASAPKPVRFPRCLPALIWPVAAFVACVARCFAADIETHRLVLPAGEAFEEGQGARLVMRNQDGAVTLYDRVLIEDDGPGIGSDAEWLETDRAPITEIAGSLRVKKVLHVEHSGAMEAHLYAPEGVGIQVNGRALEIGTPTQFPQVPPLWLKPGDNDIVLSCSGTNHRTLKIALPEDILRNAPDRKDRPPRSFTSRDGGKTWEPIQGEYMVRLHLMQYVTQGNFISPVQDLGRSDESQGLLLTPVSVQSVSLTANAETPEGTRVELSFRTGPSPVYDAALWSDWQSDAAPAPRENRYLQWKAVLFSSDPLKTPRLASVTVETKIIPHPAPSWAKTLTVGSFHNEEIRSTSLPFEYEDPLNPRLVALRQKYKLDQVIAGAATETEQLVKLRDWVAHQWPFKVPVANFPPWDADEILTRKCGFCVQYAIVLMQSAISLGHQARFVFGHNPGAFDGGGHEVCEVWSNEHRKWIFLDVNQDWHYADPKTLVPKSMLEVHDLIMKTYYGDQPVSLANPPQKRLPTDDLAICYGTSMVPGLPPAEFARHYVDGHYTVPTRWLFINYLPRNNFLTQPYPQPKTQGSHWDWSEYWCWEDAQMPKRWLYHNFTARRNDLNWSINQVRFDAAITDHPGALVLQMGTFTPYFDTFLVKTDEQSGWQKSSRTLPWQLHPGRNRIEMRVRNQSGVEGPVSFLEVDYPTATAQ